LHAETPHPNADPGRDLGYPVSIELDDARVLTVYYHVQDDGLCFIEGAFYRP